MKKQYVVREAYSDNLMVLLYENGKLECYDIVPHYEVTGYILGLENHGYEQAFFVEEYIERFEEARERLNYAINELDDAKRYPLELSTEEAEEYKRITGFSK